MSLLLRRTSNILWGVLAVVSALSGVAEAANKTLIDYFLPMPVQGKLTKDAWGADNVLPRDPQNGLEDATLKQWYYWTARF